MTGLRNSKKILFLVLAAAFVIRLGFVLLLDPGGFYFSDTRHYDRAARGLLSGEGFGLKYYRSPFYPILMAGVYSLFGPSFLAMRILEVFLGTLLCLVIHELARRLFSETVALVTVAVMAVHPHFIVLTGILYSTNLFALLLALALFFLTRTKNYPTTGDVINASLFSGLAALTIPAMFFIVPFWLIWLLLRPAGSSLPYALFASARLLCLKSRWWSGAGRRLLCASLFLVIFAAVLTPWTVRNYYRYGRIIFVRPLPNRALPDLERPPSQRQDIDEKFKDITRYLVQNPNGTHEDHITETFKHYLRHPWGAFRYALSEMAHFWALFPDRLDSMKDAYREKMVSRDSRMVMFGDSFWDLIRIMSILVMAPIFALALFGLARTRRFNSGMVLILLTLFSISLGYSLIYAEVRYRIPIEPYVLMFTSTGALELIRSARRWLKAKKG